MSSKIRPPQHVDDSEKTQIRPDLSVGHQDNSENERTMVHSSEWQPDSPPESRTQVDLRTGENPKFAAQTIRAPLARPLTPPNPPALDLDATRTMPEGAYVPPNQRPKRGSISPPNNMPAFLETTATRFAPMDAGNPNAAPLPFAEIPAPVPAPPDKSLDRKLMILAGVAAGLVLAAILLNVYG